MAALVGGPLARICGEEDNAAPKHEQATVEQLTKTLAEGVAEDRMHVARGLGRMKSKEAVPALILALDDRNDVVRAWSAWALGEIGDEAAIDPLINGMEKWLALLPEDALREQTRCLEDFDAALNKLTGRDFGCDMERWRKWRIGQVKGKAGKDM
jgi:hypothetical protein